MCSMTSIISCYALLLLMLNKVLTDTSFYCPANSSPCIMAFESDWVDAVFHTNSSEPVYLSHEGSNRHLVDFFKNGLMAETSLQLYQVERLKNGSYQLSIKILTSETSGCYCLTENEGFGKKLCILVQLLGRREYVTYVVGNPVNISCKMTSNVNPVWSHLNSCKDVEDIVRNGKVLVDKKSLYESHLSIDNVSNLGIRKPTLDLNGSTFVCQEEDGLGAKHYFKTIAVLLSSTKAPVTMETMNSSLDHTVPSNQGINHPSTAKSPTNESASANDWSTNNETGIIIVIALVCGTLFLVVAFIVYKRYNTICDWCNKRNNNTSGSPIVSPKEGEQLQTKKKKNAKTNQEQDGLVVRLRTSSN